MKKMMGLLMMMLAVCLPVMAQTAADVPAEDYDTMIATFAGFASGVVLLVEGIKALFPKMEGLVTQIVSWAVGIAAAMLLWWLDAGFVADVEWYIALLYGLGASLVANGIADTGFIQWIIGLFRKKTEA
ncbi:hypothetical protein DW986_03140 [Parabacteroides merdae]|jgi:hypothetical protein|uniref:Holin n=2 Tax=Parabacteroides merdae TaxID=46503 RepID=A0A3R6C1U5_9BACT|nr:hypothetical protein [Parabacteroides merdae]RGZ50274.1 hypothetical protein DW986_03140 [Parabacteroides merdae]RHH74698.1 hypothetical protein DW191_17440 [Parabacteroides merdae]DAY51090.1 MAG TPA: holin [Caudoviricetes sp.]